MVLVAAKKAATIIDFCCAMVVVLLANIRVERVCFCWMSLSALDLF